MGGGKSQKGGKHGFIGRTLAHDILARQAKMSEGVNHFHSQRHVEVSVLERNNLDEFTLAAQEGLESYLNTHATMKEVISSDFNSQLERMINYSETKEYKVYPVVPTPRRCLFFDDTHREIIGKLIKQREHEQYMKEKRKDKRKNKKLVDMYMRGTGPKPVHGIYDPYKTRGNRNRQRFEEDATPYQDQESEVFSGPEDDGVFDDDSSQDDDVDVDEEEEEEDSDDNDDLEADDIKDADSDAASVANGQTDDEAYGVPIQAEVNRPSGSSEPVVVEHSEAASDYTGESDDWENLEEEEMDGDNDEDYSDSDDYEEERIRTKKVLFTKTQVKPIPAVVKPSELETVDNNRKIEGSIKYVTEYKSAINQEISDVDICKMSASELNHVEMKCFYAWRRLLSRIEDEEGRVVTPYEKNIEFWRQLWRVIERSHVVMIIVDARDPLFYRVPDLETYIKEVDKRKEIMLILNKADYLSLELRKSWASYFKKKSLAFVFFSTVWVNASGSSPKPEEAAEDLFCRVYNVEMLIGKIHEYRKKQNDLFPELREENNPENPTYTVGFVGYPNVGKSSLINCLMQVTKTTVSCQPGKTKHFQTLALKKANITLCDCPGLIFPNIVATKHHLLVNSIVSTSHFRGSLIFAIQLICNRIPKQLCERYDVNLAECVITTKDKKRVLFSQRLLECICHSRKFYSGGKGGQPDIGRAAKLVLKDYINGNLLYCAWPPTSEKFFSESESLLDITEDELQLSSDLSNLKVTAKDKIKVENERKTPHEMKLAEARMQQWLMDTAEDLNVSKEKPMTKRKLRFLIKGKRKNLSKTADPYA